VWLGSQETSNLFGGPVTCPYQALHDHLDPIEASMSRLVARLVALAEQVEDTVQGGVGGSEVGREAV
jgi:hypothetical protein